MYGFDRPQVFLEVRREVATRLGVPLVSFPVLTLLENEEIEARVNILIREVDDSCVDYSGYILQHWNEIEVWEVYQFALQRCREQVAYVRTLPKSSPP